MTGINAGKFSRLTVTNINIWFGLGFVRFFICYFVLCVHFGPRKKIVDLSTKKSIKIKASLWNNLFNKFTLNLKTLNDIILGVCPLAAEMATTMTKVVVKATFNKWYFIIWVNDILYSFSFIKRIRLIFPSSPKKPHRFQQDFQILLQNPL